MNNIPPPTTGDDLPERLPREFPGPLPRSRRLEAFTDICVGSAVALAIPGGRSWRALISMSEAGSKLK
jgi:hypothetical protein